MRLELVVQVGRRDGLGGGGCEAGEEFVDVFD